MPQILKMIDHIVVVMLENRSFDNLLGFLYVDQDNKPPLNLPAKNPTTYDGLLMPASSDRFWNPTNPGFFSNSDPPLKTFASTPTTGGSALTVPDPDPNEAFLNFNFQIFGTTQPSEQQPATMLGFYVDFLNAKHSTPSAAPQIMESYSPAQLPVLSELAKQFAVCDAWFGSAPAQTWPNRGFVHTGTSRGEVTNGDIFAYDTRTIYEVLERRGISWAVFNDSTLMSLTRLQYPRLLLQNESHFLSFDDFKDQAKAGTLPAYSFVEPCFTLSPNDQHPPHDVTAGEKFLFDTWKAISTSPKWKQTVLLITYDEHGGCYDHVAPPWGATVPDSKSDPGQQGFRFNRFGVRVPTVVISPFIEPGTVFRSPTEVPYDHTSILATLRDWLGIPPPSMLDALIPGMVRNWPHFPSSSMLDSRRIKAAPALEQLFTRDSPRSDIPAIPEPRAFPAIAPEVEATEPLNELHKSMMMAAEAHRRGRQLSLTETVDLLQRVNTKQAMHKYFVQNNLIKKN